MDFDIVKLRCDLDEYAFTTMDGIARKTAELYIGSKRPTRVEYYRTADDKYATWPIKKT